MTRLTILLTFLAGRLMLLNCDPIEVESLPDPDPIPEPIPEPGDGETSISRSELTVFEAPLGAPENLTYSVCAISTHSTKSFTRILQKRTTRDLCI